MTTSVSGKIRILLKTNTKKGFLEILANWKVWTWKYEHVQHSILSWGSFCLNYCSNAAWHEVGSLWHCSGVMRAQVALIVAFSSSALLGLAYRIFLFTISHRFSMGLRSGEFAGQLRRGIPWSLNQVLVALALCAGAKSWWKMKSASPYSWSAAGSIKCSKTSWYTAVLTLDLRKHSGPTPADDMAPQTITDCGNWRITNVILCLMWIHVLTKRCWARQRCLRSFPDHLGLGQLCLLSMSQTTVSWPDVDSIGLLDHGKFPGTN